MSAMLDGLLQADQEFFLWLNGWHSPFWDAVMAAITYKFTWVPLYFALIYILISHFKTKAFGYLLCIIAVVALSDQIASGLFKPYFMRLRPCHDPVIGALVHLVKGCGGKYGFVSSHAATGFGIATSFNKLPFTKISHASWLYGWAFLYSYSRIYVGVHYPLDIAIGAIVGVLVGLLLVAAYRWSTRNSHSPYF
ncbi:phosphatase PAP2 family protein [Salmonirosea aquatica]|uniref:Phosphatase PAP2 family protein n=1 Tax=Salmonirosea aquatica TaxID=2654236 RepID=A0A7C9BDQ3_9BACT|nr:phosphatase PAP2 family protein [Cytophagaceae bacterium SJW1-29]